MDIQEQRKKQRVRYGKYLHFAKFIIRLFLPKMKVVGLENLGPAPGIFISRHKDTFGPMCAIVFLPVHLRIWVLHKLASYSEALEHYTTYTFRQRHGWPRFFAKIGGWVMTVVCVPLMKSLEAIPVYRGQKDILMTFKQSIQALDQGDNLLIMPEIDYLNTMDASGDLYNGFTHIVQLYYSLRKKIIPLYPLYPSRENKTLYIGKPIFYDPKNGFRQERERICALLKDALSGDPSSFGIPARGEGVELR